nr:MAG TPA: hypothetical protein [Caudoviricetes sp.]
MVRSFNIVSKESYNQTIGYPHVSHGYTYILTLLKVLILHLKC